MKLLKKNLKLISFSSLIVGSFISVNANPAHGMITTYSDFSSWNTEVGSSVVESFGTDTLLTSGNSESFNGFSVNATFGAGDSVAVSGGELVWSGNLVDPAPEITLTFDSPVNGFAFDWVDNDATNFYELTVDGQTFSNPPFDNTNAINVTDFFGVVSTTSFSTATFTDDGSIGNLDNFRIDNVRTSAAVPFEFSPTMGLLIIGGLIGANNFRKRNFKSIVLEKNDF